MFHDPGGDWYWEEHTKVQHSCDVEEDLAISPNDSEYRDDLSALNQLNKPKYIKSKELLLGLQGYCP